MKIKKRKLAARREAGRVIRRVVAALNRGDVGSNLAFRADVREAALSCTTEPVEFKLAA